MSGATLDAGALIALERGSPYMIALLAQTHRTADRLAVPAGVLAQVWRDGRTQVVLARFLRSSLCEVVPLDVSDAKLAGQLCGLTGTADVVDATVVVVARRRRHRVVTSDPHDLRRLDADQELMVV